MPIVHVVGAALFRDGRCLVAQRGPSMQAAGRWEFPGGKVEVGEEPRQALARELREELGIEATIGGRLGRGEASSGDLRIILDVYEGRVVSGEPRPIEHRALAWLDADALPRLDWADADVPVVPRVVAALRSRKPG